MTNKPAEQLLEAAEVAITYGERARMKIYRAATRRN